MSQSKIDELLAHLHTLEQKLEQEFEQLLQEKRELFQYKLQKGKVQFENSIKTLQRDYKRNSWGYLIGAPLSKLLTAPVIYSVIIPMVFLDIAVTIYQHICFRAYNIPRVKRSNYIVIDRHHLAYLNVIQKINCMYCGYANGLIAYVGEVTARTEQYWCPIKHAKRVSGSHRRVGGFVDYGDAEGYKQRLQDLREKLKNEKT